MPKQDWERYAVHRNLSRNRLLLPWHGEVVEEFVGFFGGVPNDSRVLDIGPANGFFMVLLRELGFENVHGLEISKTFLEKLRAKNLKAFEGDIVEGRGLGGLDAPYDVVVMMEILEHLEDPGRALRHARSLLKPDGLLFATVPACLDVFDGFRRLWQRRSRRDQVLAIDETHLHAFSPRDLRALFAGAGFDVASLKRLSLRPPFAERYVPGHRGFLLLRALLPRAWRGLCLGVVARPAAGVEGAGRRAPEAAGCGR
jgi:2-polyprenyl-3-methyl-5-hydroxy-6-metoxy-1,4-benzoquinol methylase